MRTRAFWIVALIAVVASAEGQQRDRDRRPIPSITVTGIGEARGTPDIANIQVGVVSQDKSAAAVVEQNNEASAKLIAALKEQGLAERDIQTMRFDLSPRYEQDPQGRVRPEIVGYEAANIIQITARDLAGLGKLLDEAIAAGANRIDGISFDIEDQRKLLDEARREAIDEARHAAEIVADAAEVRPGRVLSVREQRAGPPEPFGQPRRFAAGAMEGAVPVAPGEQTVRVNVEVKYAIEEVRGGNRP